MSQLSHLSPSTWPNEKNNIDANCMNIGVWDSDGDLEFIDRNDSGDSSFIKNFQSEEGNKIAVRRLDSLPEINEFSMIKLLKVEAEGGEPEVLMGATGILPKVEFVSVDCGFERGVAQKSTADEVIKVMLENEFECIGCNPVRLALAFQRRSRSSSTVPVQ